MIVSVWAKGAEAELAIWSLHKCCLTLQLLSPTHNNSHLWNVFLVKSHTTFLFRVSACVCVVFLSLSSLSPWCCKAGSSLGPLCRLCLCDKNEAPSNLLAAGIKACVVCQSTFLISTQVLNSYLRLHIAAIMLTALFDHKTHTHKEHTDKQTYATTQHSQAYSLTLLLFVSLALAYTFHRLCPNSECIIYVL